MHDWQIFWVILPTIIVWIWHSHRIDTLRDQLARLELRLQEEKNAAFNANMLRTVEEILAQDDEARGIARD